MTDQIPSWVQRINESKKKEDEIFKLFFYLMKELNLSYRDLCEMPVPAIIEIADQLVRHAKEEQKAMKKARK